jgi:hypothetical protein
MKEEDRNGSILVELVDDIAARQTAIIECNEGDTIRLQGLYDD